jgi:hypothetical protein
MRVIARTKETAMRLSIRFATLTILLASLILAPGALPGAVPASAQGDCTFTGALETLILYHAPLTTPTQQKDALPGGVGFRLTLQRAEHYYVAVDDAYGGWVDRRSGGLSGDCAGVPVDTAPLTDYEALCFFTSPQAAQLFHESRRANPKETIQPGQAYPVTLQTFDAYHLQLDHAFGGWVAAADGQVSGNCAGVPTEYPAQIATALENARAWSAPDVRSGDVVTTFAPGTQLMVLAGPVTGPIRLDTADTGNWFQVRAVNAAGGATGWVWENRLRFSPPPGPGGPTAVALANARVWSLPDVHTGAWIASLVEGSAVRILGGPVTGPIRYDTTDTGNWYRIAQDATGITGWVWRERLIFD